MEISNLTFAEMVGRYIEHANQLNKVSPRYHNMKYLKNLGKCNEILSWLKRNNYDVGLKALCKMICEYNENLFGILPHTLNTSYRNSLKRVTDIVTNAEKVMQGEKIEIHQL